MLWIAAIGIGLLILMLSGGSSKGVPLLSFRMGSSNGEDYLIQLKKEQAILDKPEMFESECVRMVLHFTTRMFFNLHKDGVSQTEELLTFIENIINTDMTGRDVDIYLPLVLDIHDGNPTQNVFQSQLYYTKAPKRGMSNKVPLKVFPQQYIHSVMLLIRYIVAVIGIDERQKLKYALKFLVESYRGGANPQSVSSLMLSDKAFLASDILQLADMD